MFIIILNILTKLNKTYLLKYLILIISLQNTNNKISNQLTYVYEAYASKVFNINTILNFIHQVSLA